LALSACAIPGLDTSESEVSLFKAGLSQEPASCRGYRTLYVRGFKANVESLSKSDPEKAEEADRLLAASEAILAESQLTKDQCSRPYCIIEPLQGGKLDSWCGYRIPAERGPELYQWLNWSEAEDPVGGL